MSFYPGYTETEQNQFDRLGHPGKWTSVFKIDDQDQHDFTGSMYGYGGIMNASFAADTPPAGTIVLSGGGSITPEEIFQIRGVDGAGDSTLSLTNSGIIELSIAQITLTQGAVYVFKRQTGF